MKKESKNIETVVLNCFIRVVKSEGKYLLFRSCVKNDGIMRFLLKKTMPLNSPFINASNQKEIVDILEKITIDMAKNNGTKDLDELDKYEHVTMAINHLLHFFMESNGVPMKVLCLMGEKIYALSCNKLFGDKIEDIQEMQKNESYEDENVNQLNKIFNEYVSKIASGKINKNISFAEYLKKRSINFNDGFKNVKIGLDENVGHKLNNINGNEFLRTFTDFGDFDEYDSPF